jgi:prepilin-type N-terminal cleavage/methylation domain-containing protein
MTRRRAFTLVELVVVVGIVALLLALLIPALSTARRQARSVQCLAHLRQLAAGFHMYLAQNKGRGFQTIYVNGGWGPEAIENYLFPNRRQGEQSRIMFCPEADEPTWRRPAGSDMYALVFPGGTFRPWGYSDALGSVEQLTAPFRGSSYDRYKGSGAESS